MNRIKNAFEKGKQFVGFLMAGDPSIELTYEYILEMINAGCGVIEIGVPFSDPIAEGEVIQKASVRALKNNISLRDVFKLVEDVRKVNKDIPLVLLTYLNPVFKYGYKAFAKKCLEVGVDGVIIPDMPKEESSELDVFLKNDNVDLITLISPCSNDRIANLAKDARGYVYCVTSLGVTGIRKNIPTNVNQLVAKIREVNSNTPIAVGFGIATPEQSKEMSAIADGVIVGSRIVKIIEEYKERAHKKLFEYVKQMIVF